MELATQADLHLIQAVVGDFTLNADFKFCKIHENRAVWDLPDSCQTPTVLNKQSDRYYYVLKELTYPVSGTGWHCSMKQTTIFTHMDFWGWKSFETFTEHAKLSSDQCNTMVTEKKCLGLSMSCNGNFCSTSNVIPNGEDLTYYWLQSSKETFFSCEIYPQTITAKTNNSKIFFNTDSIDNCRAIDGYCKSKTGITIRAPSRW